MYIRSRRGTSPPRRPASHTCPHIEGLGSDRTLLHFSPHTLMQLGICKRSAVSVGRAREFADHVIRERAVNPLACVHLARNLPVHTSSQKHVPWIFFFQPVASILQPPRFVL